MTAATGTVRGRLARLSGVRRARNGRSFAVAVVTAYSKRQGSTFSWRVIVAGRALEIASRTPIGSTVVACGEIFVTPSTDPRMSMSMACREFLPASEPRRARTATPLAPLSPKEAAERLFRAPVQCELDL